jgi:hypothetical protein
MQTMSRLEGKAGIPSHKMPLAWMDPHQEEKMSKRNILLIISLMFIVGGIGRLVANVGVFRIFGMEDLWSDEPFFIYNYKLLGVVVIWIGIVLYVSSKDLSSYRDMIRGSILALLLFFVVSLFVGLSFGLKFKLFLVDSVFSLFLVVAFYIVQKK